MEESKITPIRFNAMRELIEVENEFNKIFCDIDRRFGFSGNSAENSELAEALWLPLTDIYEDDENFKLRIDLPDVTKDDLKISFSNGQLLISGERKQEQDSENYKYHRVEKCYGKFYRSFEIPNDIHEDKINADFKNGQLTIVIPKTPKAIPRMIDVKVY